MPKTYLIRIDDEEIWRRFHSLCALQGCTIKETLWGLITDFVQNHEQGNEPKRPTKKEGE
jgi:hypothetical protein